MPSSPRMIYFHGGTSRRETLARKYFHVSFTLRLTGLNIYRYGGIFSTAADLTRLGQSILNSSILNPSTTRAWLKPTTHTADLHMSVGMPWEIRRALLPLGHGGTRVVDLYTKNGAFGLYSAMIVLSPDHGLGYVVLIAGSGGDSLLGYLPDLLAETLLPAAESAARETSAARFAGIYQGTSHKMTVEMNETLVVR